MSQPIDSLRGLGPVSRKILAKAGISTVEALREAGPVAAFIAAKAVDPKASLNLLWGIAGALTDTHWSKLDPALKSSLLLEYDAYCDMQSSSGRTPSRRAR